MPVLDNLYAALSPALRHEWVPPPTTPLLSPPRPYYDLLTALAQRRSGMQGAHAGNVATRGKMAASRGIVAPRPAAVDPHALTLQIQTRTRNVSHSGVQHLLHKRMQLPVYKRKAEILSAVLLSKSVVTVIGGETGSGKTTQVTGRCCIYLCRRVALIETVAHI